MNIKKFRDEMSKCVKILESENLYSESEYQKNSSIEVIAAWDYHSILQVLLSVTAGSYSGFAGYSAKVDPGQRSRLENLERDLAIIMRYNGMWGDGLLTRMRKNPSSEILWRYPENGELHPATLPEVKEQTALIPRWLDPEFFNDI